MHQVSLARLYMMKGAYLIIAVGLGVMIWPGLIDPPADLEHTRGVVRALLGAVGLLAVIGIRYPLQMLPLLFFELAWKVIWLLVFGLPRWSADVLDQATSATLFDCTFGVVLCVVAVPWKYAYASFVRRPGDPWRPPRPLSWEAHKR